MKKVIGGFIILTNFFSCADKGKVSSKIDTTLFSGFQNPPAEARPFVR